jgi:hypothetical protein
MELRLMQQTEGYTDYAGVLASAPGVVIELRLTLVEGGTPYLNLIAGDDQRRG